MIFARASSSTSLPLLHWEVVLKETPGRREGGSRGPESPLELLTLATGRRKPFSEGLGRASSKQ